MNEKTVNIIKIVVALLLLTGISVGLFFGGRWMIGELDSIFVKDSTLDENGNTKLPVGSETQKPDESGTQKPDESGTQAPSTNDNVGELVVWESSHAGYWSYDGYTIIFYVFDPGMQTCSLHGVEHDCHYFYIDKNKVSSYGSMDTSIRVSKDGVIWSDPEIEGDYYKFVADERIYVSYLMIQGGRDAWRELEEVIVNAFERPDMFGYEAQCVPK